MTARWIATAALLAASPAAAQSAAAPTGLDPLGQMQAVSPAADAAFRFRRLRSGVQFTLSGVTKSVIFYAPGVVRVNANLGRSLLDRAQPRGDPRARGGTVHPARDSGHA